MTSRNGEQLDGLTDKQCRFVAEYLLTLNATDAARKAGYKQPNVASAKLMPNSRIAKCIGNAQRQSLENGLAHVLRARIVTREERSSC